MNTSSFLRHTVALAFLAATRVCAVDVVVGPVTNPSNGHNYYLLTAGTWQDSEAKARQMDGHLAIVRDQGENNWIAYTFGTYNSVNRILWIGRTNSPQGWVNVDGEPVTFTNWSIYQPDNFGGNEYYATLLGAEGFIQYAGMGQWNDFPNQPYSGDLVYGVVEVSPLPPVIAGPILNPANTHVYYLLADSSWTTAEAQAQKLGGHLATVNDAAENAWISSTFFNYGGVRSELWIGLKRNQPGAPFSWVNGDPMTFTNWRAGEPNNLGGVESYGEMVYDGNFDWNDLPDYAPTDTFPTKGVVEVVPGSTLPELVAHHAIEVEWQSEKGKFYQPQSRLSTEAKWTNDGEPVQGTGGKTSILERAESPMKFYRVVPLN